MTTPKLRFTIDKAYDARMIYVMVRSSTAVQLRPLAIVLSVDFKKVQQWHRLPWGRAKGSILQVVQERYRKVGKFLKVAQVQYQASWDQMNAEFFRTLEWRTGYTCEFTEYTCVVSAFHRGISNWNGSVISRIWSENPHTMRKFTAHEIIIAHIFWIFRSDHTLSKLTDRQIWRIAEISAWCLTGLDKHFLHFWPWITEEQKFPFRHNYPELVALQKKLGKVFITTKNFPSFLRKAAVIVKGAH